MSIIRVLIADDHALVRAGVRSLLAGIEGVRVVGETGDGREVVRLVGELRPHVLLLDITMPGLNGVDAAAIVARDFPNTRTVILSMHANEEYVLQSLRAGACGYLLKDSSVTELELAVAAVARGEVYLSPAVSKHLVSAYVQSAGIESTPLEQLTPRQREVLQLIAEGNSTKEIARVLEISPKTVETFRAQLMERLGVRDIAGLVRCAVRLGLVPSDV